MVLTAEDRLTVGYSCFLGYGAVFLGGWLLMFPRNVVPSSLRVKRPQKN